MKAVEFAFWLQGYFEISGDDSKPLTSKQAAQVASTAEKVEQGAGAVEEKASLVAAFVDGALFRARSGSMTEAELSNSTAAIKQRLHDLFVHAIDPTLPGDQAELRKKHDGDKPSSDPFQEMIESNRRAGPGGPQAFC